MYSISERAKIFLEQLQEEYQDDPDINELIEYISETVAKYEDLATS